MTALGALTERSVLGTLRDGDLIFAIGGPIAFFLCFNVTLRNVIDTGGMSYPQYILPVIVVQAMIFTAMTTADRAARDHLSGMGIRLRSHAHDVAGSRHGPDAVVADPRDGRTGRGASPSATRSASGSTVDVLERRWRSCAIALVLSLALSLGADAMGSVATNAEAAGPDPADPPAAAGDAVDRHRARRGVPRLARAVRAQPTGLAARRDAARPGPRRRRAANLLISLAWCVGLLLVFGAIAVRMQRRRYA